jgi:hypothetical protein
MKKNIVRTAKKVRFLDREYGSYRIGIIEFFAKSVVEKNKIILDPMAGNGSLIPVVETKGATAYFNDIMPFYYYLNRAKTYKAYSTFKKHEKNDRDFLYKEASHCLRGLKNKHLVISQNWIADKILENLIEAWNRTNRYKGALKDLLRAIIILCVRPYSCYTPSKSNGTWFKMGGVSTGAPLSEIIRGDIKKFQNYYNIHYSNIKSAKIGKSYFSNEDALNLSLKNKVDIVFTSPPFCNRLEPVNMYAPELFFLSFVGHKIKDEDIIGTTRVKDYTHISKDLDYIRKVAPETFKFLESVKETERKTENNYYLKYFTRYYAKLYQTLKNAMRMVRKRGRVYVDMQDNIHRGSLNDTGKFITDFFNNLGWKTKIPYRNLEGHQGRRNISEYHPLVVKKHWEHIIEAQR